jgi:hypothetical protein
MYVLAFCFVSDFTFPSNCDVSFLFANNIQLFCILESFIYPTDAKSVCSKNVKIYMRGAATCFGFHNHHLGATICALLQL